MSVLILLIFASLAVATAFLLGFIWAVTSGQYEDTCTPSLRLLLDETKPGRKQPEQLENTENTNS
jgi:cbb3-type cytochrome oxidase maturation protein